MLRNTYEIDDNASRLDTHFIYQQLCQCFWVKDLQFSDVQQMIDHSLCFGIYLPSKNIQVGFGRIITDFTTFAYITDVVVNNEHRRKGLARELVKVIMNHPKLKTIKTWNLKCTAESKPIYFEHGFVELIEPKIFLEKEI